MGPRLCGGDAATKDSWQRKHWGNQVAERPGTGFIRDLAANKGGVLGKTPDKAQAPFRGDIERRASGAKEKRTGPTVCLR